MPAPNQGVVIMRPMAVTDATLVSSNVPEDDEDLYDPDTVYPLGAVVMLLATHSVYENSLPDNKGNNPKDHPNKWTRIRATNRHRLFDGANSSRTEQAGNISYVFAPGETVAMSAALDLTNCFSVQWQLVDPVYGNVYDYTALPSPSPVQSDWWEFYFGQWEGGSNVALAEGMPSFPNAELRVTFVGGPHLAVGDLMFGQPRIWGVGVKYGARLGWQLYSKREPNKYGDIELIRLPAAKTASVELVLKSSEVDPLLTYLEQIHADLCLFIVLRKYGAGVIYGLFERPVLLLDDYEQSVWDLEILGAP